MRRLFGALLSCAGLLLAQPVPSDPGVKKGSAIPAFTLQDQTGNPQSIQSLMGDRGLMLVFVRSADW
ncbi:MAG: hypothetical protein HY820_12850 [Acidobacteria bacterium]|nr:hypothetical protein [Acidobacteriota bacterium]